jgi:hypothetical protein
MDEEAATLPIANLPSDTLKVRRRFRVGAYAKVFIKARDGSIRSCYITRPDHELCVFLVSEDARNVTNSVAA